MELIVAFVLGFSAYFAREVIKKSFPDHWEAFFVWDIWPRCERCATIRGLQLESSCTMYNFDGDWFDPKNPNRPQLLCRCCAEEHHDYWDEMWADYNSGRL